MDLKKFVRDVPDFPNPGILFKDITPVLIDPAAFGAAIGGMVKSLEGVDFDFVLGPESRGFLFGAPLAARLGKGFVPVRKAGKLPRETLRADYLLEYGSASIEIHRDAVIAGARYAVADDLLATGGTAKAVAELIESNGGVVAAFVFFIELSNLGGRDTLAGYDVKSVLIY